MILTLLQSVNEELVVELEDRFGSVNVSCYCYKLIAEAEDNSGTQRKGNINRCKPLPSNGSEDVISDPSVCNDEL
jgi:hypothetical protein